MRKVMNILIAGMLLIGAVEAQAVDYKSTYQGQDRSIQPVEYQVATTATGPTATFQSTSGLAGSGSAYSANPTIGADGAAVYSAADEGGTTRHPGQIRKIGGQTIQGDPLGDAAMPLMLLVLAYLSLRVILNRKRAQKG